MTTTHAAPAPRLEFDKIARGIYRTTAHGYEFQARKVDDVWFVESRRWVDGGPFKIAGHERTLAGAKGAITRTVAAVTAARAAH